MENLPTEIIEKIFFENDYNTMSKINKRFNYISNSNKDKFKFLTIDFAKVDIKELRKFKNVQHLKIFSSERINIEKATLIIKELKKFNIKSIDFKMILAYPDELFSQSTKLYSSECPPILQHTSTVTLFILYQFIKKFTLENIYINLLFPHDDLFENIWFEQFRGLYELSFLAFLLKNRIEYSKKIIYKGKNIFVIVDSLLKICIIKLHNEKYINQIPTPISLLILKKITFKPETILIFNDNLLRLQNHFNAQFKSNNLGEGQKFVGISYILNESKYVCHCFNKNINYKFFELKKPKFYYKFINSTMTPFKVDFNNFLELVYKTKNINEIFCIDNYNIIDLVNFFKVEKEPFKCGECFHSKYYWSEKKLTFADFQNLK